MHRLLIMVAAVATALAGLPSFSEGASLRAVAVPRGEEKKRAGPAWPAQKPTPEWFAVSR
jgi:hypothetical protein